jgi:hypothetical protein
MAPCKNHATKDAKMEDGAEKKNAPKISQQKMQGGRWSGKKTPQQGKYARIAPCKNHTTKTSDGGIEPTPLT